MCISPVGEVANLSIYLTPKVLGLLECYYSGFKL